MLQGSSCYSRLIKIFIFLVPFALQGTATCAQSPEHNISFQTISARVERDTNVLADLIEQGKEIAGYDKDSAIRIFRYVVDQSGQAYFQEGMRQGLKALFPLISNDQRDRLIQALMPGVESEKKLWGVLPVLYNARAKDCQLRGQYKEASQYYLKAIPLARNYVPEYLATIYNNYGSLLLFFPETTDGDTTQALYYLDQAEAIALQNNDLKIITCVLCNKSKVFRDRKHYDTSLSISLRALRIAQKENFRQWEFVLLNNIGDLHYVMGRPEEALPFLKRAVKMDNEDMDPYYRNMVAVTLGEVYTALRDYRNAARYLLQSIKLAQKFHIGRDLIESNKKLSRLYQMTGDYKKALEYQLRASEMQDSFMNKEIVEHVKTMELKYRTAEKDKELLKNKLNIEIQAKLLRKKSSLIIIVITMAAIIVLICLALYSRFRQKQKILLRDEQIREMKALIKGEEQERIRLAQELHDGIGGMLAAVNMNMAVAHKRDFNNKAELNSIMQMIADTTEEVRKTSHNLMPSALLRKNLREALLYYFDYINKDGSLQIDLHTDNLSGNWADSDITLVFRIVQELVQNIIKHAAATHAVVCIEQEGANLSIIVEDNGSGYDISQTPRGFGLEHLDFRVRAMKGNIHINSAPGAGTSVTINLALRLISPS